MIPNSIQRRPLLVVLCCAALLAACVTHAEYPTNLITGYLTGTNNWYRTNTYQLNGMVFVRSNGVLNIEAGTIIKGHNLGTDSTNISALVICRGAKIFAEGTAKRPIIFTADVDDTFLPDDLPIWGATARGLWGGVVILGKCVLNGAIDAGGNAASPIYEVYEGMPDVVASGGEALMRFGGTDDNDNSGIFRYVSIRHGGASLFPNKEINGLSLGAVGRGTTIEFVESYCAADDGFEFFGGTVNTRYLVSSFNDDDAFDTDQGYRGTNQFWFAIQAPDKRNYGMELNNHPNELPQTSQNLPATDFKVYNMTIIGSGAANTVSSGGNNAAIALRPWASPKIYNSIFTDFNERGVLLDTQNGVIATQAVSGGFAQLHNTFWWDFAVGSATGTINNTATNLGRFTLATNYWTDTTLTNLISNPLLASISRTNVGSRLDPRPKAGSPVLSAANVAATPNDGFLTAVNYAGAFGPDDLWINGWTALSEYGILSPVGQGTNNITGYLTGTNNWYRTNIYILNGMVFVRSNAVLNIEAGTVIKGHNLGTDSTNISALVVCRDGKIFAQGTPQNPIIFTADVDDTLFNDDLPIWGSTARGLWGGVVILGKCVLNGAIDAGGNAASPIYEVYEGMPDVVASGGEALMRFGGTDDNDNSGIFRYVSIRHGGASLFPNKEINGLSLGAVGRGTTIEFVESYCAADDGFEFFGGTVNTRYLVSSFNDDDAFDTDQGYRGTNQFWFAIQAPDKRNYGMELNNHPNELPQTSQNLPATDFKVYNMTIIGSGAANTVSSGGNNAAIALRPWVGPKIYNSIFTDFNERGVVVDTQNGVTATQAVTGGFAQLHNTLWWDFVVGSATGVINNTATNLGRFTVATNYWTDTTLTNLIANPQITSISRTNFGALLDPRPATGSPALAAANVAATPVGLIAASYAGAFGAVNWASDWTALGEYGILTGAGGGNPKTTPTGTTPVKPSIVSQPVWLSKHIGSSASFSVTAIGDAPLRYQWYHTNAISGATNDTYDIPSVDVPDGGNYFVIITNNAGSVTSSVANLTVVADLTSKIIAGYLTGTNNWYRTNIYLLNGMVFVRSNGVLNIEAGTVVKGHNLGTDSTNIAALVVCRGGKLYAQGSPKRPIIFTADVDDTLVSDDLPIWGPTARGLWGGVVMLGKCVLNGAIDAGGNAASPIYEVYEGLPDVVASGGERLLRFGGTDDNDNSGILRYVSIRHGGASLFPNKEINGLSLGAVGRGTTIEFVESYCAADDGFEFFGGTVNTRYLVSSFNDDDAFDTDQGYRGTNQFWFAIQAPDKRNYGMELNNHPNELPQTSQNLPAADFKIYNMTIIGSGAANTVSSGGNNAAIALRPWVGPKIYNSIFTDFNERGVVVDTQNGVLADQAVTGGFAQLHNTLWWDFVVGSATGVINNTATNLGRFTIATNYWTDTSLTNQIANPLLASISRTNVGSRLDPRPKAGSPALADFAGTPNDGFLTPVSYRGAFGPDDLWINGWTALSEYGILSPVGQRTNTITGYLTGTNNWYRTNTYILNGMVFVRSNGVLNIEAGTVIKGHNLGTDSTNIAALVVCRGGKIFAQGTPQNPIIFTAEADDTAFPDDLAIWGPNARGLWGGVVILGKCVLNGAIDAGGNAASPIYEVYEGMPDVVASGGEALMRFGGTDDNDNSGIFRYVSIRHGGASLFPNKEINGLSLGAVGRGTTIEFVESYCAADDGFEFFGGTVNTRYLVSSFNDDDAFDTDQGYRGTNQFWFAIQAPDKRNYGMELNNHPNELPQTSQNLPAADFKIYNMTIIGSGAANTVSSGGNNAAIALRPWVGPKIYNSIFTDFNERGVVVDTQNGVTATQAVTGGFAQLHNTLWWDFVVGSATGVINNTATNLGRFTVATNYWTDTTLTNLIANPQITSISRTNVGALLDPRPAAGSPALNAANIAAAPGSLTSAGFVGAFGAMNWASDWTALGEYGIMTGNGGGNPRTVTVAAPTPNQPTLAVAAGVGLITISFVSQSGVQYQLQSATDVTTLPAGWTNDGAPQAGTGGVLTFTPTTGPGAKFFRVIVP